MALIDDVKAAMRVIHSADDALLTRLINSASLEYIQFCNIEVDSDDTTAPIGEDAFQGLVLMVQADYSADPEKRATYRKAAETLWTPYRIGWGI
jgi:hypothetical protein